MFCQIFLREGFKYFCSCRVTSLMETGRVSWRRVAWLDRSWCSNSTDKRTMSPQQRTYLDQITWTVMARIDQLSNHCWFYYNVPSYKRQDHYHCVPTQQSSNNLFKYFLTVVVRSMIILRMSEQQLSKWFKISPLGLTCLGCGASVTQFKFYHGPLLALLLALVLHWGDSAGLIFAILQKDH